MKTKKSLLKRVKITKRGTVIRARSNARHLRSRKSKRRIRLFREPKIVEGAMARRILRFIPHAV